MRRIQLRSLALLACAPLALAGCFDLFFEDPGEPDPNVDPPASKAQALFTREVYPILATRCASCHGPSSQWLGFVGKNPTDGYELILSFSAVVGDFTPDAPVLRLPITGHKASTYTAAEQRAVGEWLEAERIERGGGPLPPPPPTLDALLKTWSGCLDFNDFQSTNMTAAWNALATSGSQQCTDCHTGTSGFTVSSDPAEFFRRITTRRTTLLTFFQPELVTRTVMLPNHPLFVAVSSQADPHREHPVFTYTGGARTALTALADKTAARLRANPGACSPPRLQD